MRIGILTTSFPRFSGDHAGLFVLEGARALAARGHQIDVLAPEPAGLLPATRADWGGVRLHWVRYGWPQRLQQTFYGDGVPDNVRTNPWAWPGLFTFGPALTLAASRFSSWDGLISHWAMPCALAAGAVRGRRPHLSIFHSADVWLLQRLPALVRHAVLRASTATWFLTARAREDVLGRSDHAVPSEVGPMGIAAPPTAYLPQRSSTPDPQAHPLRVLVMSRLVPIKGVDVALRAVAGLKGVTLTVAGDGGERAKLEALARSLGAPVEFLGFVRGEAKERMFRNHDLLLVPSRRTASGRKEGIPTVILEASIRGLPVVCSRTGGSQELFDAASIYWVEPDQPQQLRSLLLRLADARCELNLVAERARALASAHLWDAKSERMEDLLFGAERGSERV